MDKTLTFDGLIRLLHQQLEQLPDHRTGKNTSYAIKDAGLGAFAVFFIQSPSFLAHQRQMSRAKGQSNAESFFGIAQIPSDNQIRNLLDPIAPQQLFPLFRIIVEALEQSSRLDSFRFLDDNLLNSLDGTRYFSSQKISCQNCSRSTTGDGVATYFHDVIIPVLVAPGSKRVINLEPEFIVPQDGHDKQDCEQTAAKRWIRRNAEHLASRKVTVLGDDLYCKQPFCELLLEKGFNFILVCKPDSHPALYEWVDFTGAQERVVRHWNGRYGEIHSCRYVHHVPLRRGDGALFVDWCELTITHETTGAILYRNAFGTNHLVSEENVAAIVQAGRARWKSENEP
jgi:hypothetical protein